MQYTFAQACNRLAGRTLGMASSPVAAAAKVKDEINEAIQELAGLSGWECLRRVLRFISVGPCFALPQGSAGLVRLCMNGRPAMLRTPDFRFIQSGPGDLRRPPAGFCPIDVNNVIDGGRKPTIVEPQAPFRLFAYSDSPGQPDLKVRGVDPTGRDVTLAVPMEGVYDSVTGAYGSESDSDPYQTEISVDAILQQVTAVVVDADASSYITLFAEDVQSGDRFPIALYHPDVKVPGFRHYHTPGVRPGQPVELLAEVRIEPLPLVRDDDVIPFDTLDPIEWMMRSRWCMQSGEVDQAGKYQERAQQWLKARELADNQVQTSVVINNVFANSLGEASLETWNI